MAEDRPMFEEALRELINKYSIENMSDTPDYILANYMSACLAAYNSAVTSRDEWFGVDMWAADKLSKK